MENYDKITLVSRYLNMDITYEEYVMYMASPEKDWYRIDFQKDGKFHRLDGPAIEYADGTKEWWVDGKRHRLDGPAVHVPDNTRAWYLNGKLHRSDGPAIERKDGSKEWWLNGHEHRLDGPAIERANKKKQYWINGNRYKTKREYLKRRDYYVNKKELRENLVEEIAGLSDLWVNKIDQNLALHMKTVLGRLLSSDNISDEVERYIDSMFPGNDKQEVNCD